MTRILVVKLSALGNVICSLGPFAAIRRHHADAEITVLTTAPYADYLAGSPYFDRVMIDRRAAWWDLRGWWQLRRQLIGGRFDRVYDLQTSGRSSRIFHSFPANARPEWSGIAYGCSHPDRDPRRNLLHDVDRQFGQLRAAGVLQLAAADLSWSHAEIARFQLPPDIVLLVPGSSAHRPAKRWPIAQYRELAAALVQRGLTPVVLGTAAERELAGEICQAVSRAIDLTGQTNLAELASLARAARFAIGNDTGPMHLIAVAGCPSIVLFSHDSDPALCAPRGISVTVLRRPDLASLDVATVLAALPAAAPREGKQTDAMTA
jgi:ADP-heptose:LPS heptosyltransferase